MPDEQQDKTQEQEEQEERELRRKSKESQKAGAEAAGSPQQKPEQKEVAGAEEPKEAAKEGAEEPEAQKEEAADEGDAASGGKVKKKASKKKLKTKGGDGADGDGGEDGGDGENRPVSAGSARSGKSGKKRQSNAGGAGAEEGGGGAGAGAAEATPSEAAQAAALPPTAAPSVAASTPASAAPSRPESAADTAPVGSRPSSAVQGGGEKKKKKAKGGAGKKGDADAEEGDPSADGAADAAPSGSPASQPGKGKKKRVSHLQQDSAADAPLPPSAVPSVAGDTGARSRPESAAPPPVTDPRPPSASRAEMEEMEQRLAAAEAEAAQLKKEVLDARSRAEVAEQERNEAVRMEKSAKEEHRRMEREARRLKEGWDAERAQRSAAMHKEKDQLLQVLRKSVANRKQLSQGTLERVLADLGARGPDDLAAAGLLTQSGQQLRSSRVAVESVAPDPSQAMRAADEVSPAVLVAADHIADLLDQAHPDELWEHAGACRRRGDRESEERFLMQYLRIALLEHDREMEAKAYRQLAQLHYDQRDLERAEDWHDRLFRVSQLRGDDDGQVRAATGLGDIHGRRGRFDKASYYYRKARALTERRHQTVYWPRSEQAPSPAALLGPDPLAAGHARQLHSTYPPPAAGGGGAGAAALLSRGR